MAKFVLAYHGGGMAPTEAEQQAVMAAWGAWFGELGAAVVDGGAPTYPVSTVAADGSVHPGGGANPLSGYSIIEAADAEAAVGLAAGCPVLAAGGSVEVAAVIEM